MKKLLFLICLANSLMFAQNLQNYELINLATNDLRGVAVDDEECQKAILDFYSLIVKNDKQTIKLSKEYKECMAKKAQARVKETKKELEALNQQSENSENLVLSNNLDTNETVSVNGFDEAKEN